ncbi:hypothetical protein IAR50_003095 [Cryptococcus sp. DSM 104548]
MTHMSPASLLFASMCTSIYTVGGYSTLPTLPDETIIPTSFALWLVHYQAVTPALYYILVSGFCMTGMIYVKEMYFWLYLSSSIRRTTTVTWLLSVHFKPWLALTLVVVGSRIAVVVPVNDNPDMMEAFSNVSHSIANSFSTAYVYLILLLGFQQYHGLDADCMGQIAAGLVFSIPFITVAIDGLTPHHDIASNLFLTDLFIMFGLAGSMVSVIIISVYLFFPPLNASPERSLLPAVQQSVPEEPISITRSGSTSGHAGKGAGMSSALTNGIDDSPHTFSAGDDIEKHQEVFSFTAAGGRYESRDDDEKDDLEDYYFEDEAKQSARGMGMELVDQRMAPFATPLTSPTSPTIPTSTTAPLLLTSTRLTTPIKPGEKREKMLRSSKANSSTSNAAIFAPSFSAPSSRSGYGRFDNWS